MKFLTYLFVISFFVLLLILWTKVYFKAISSILIHKGKSQLVSVRPSSSFFASLRSSRSCFVSLGNGYVAWQHSGSDEDSSQGFSDLVSVDDFVYIFRIRFGRLKGIDLSDRRLTDILKKYR